MRGCIPLSDEQISLVTAQLDCRDRAWFTLGIRTGFRITEILSLELKDVWDGRTVRDAVQVRKQNTKGKSSSRCLALHPEARMALKAWIDVRGVTDGMLFSSRKGGALNRKSAWRILNLAFKAAGVSGLKGQLGTHTARKTFAKRMYQRLGSDLIKTRQALGHVSILSTASYLSFDEDEITKAILAS